MAQFISAPIIPRFAFKVLIGIQKTFNFYPNLHVFMSRQNIA